MPILLGIALSFVVGSAIMWAGFALGYKVGHRHGLEDAINWPKIFDAHIKAHRELEKRGVL